MPWIWVLCLLIGIEGVRIGKAGHVDAKIKQTDIRLTWRTDYTAQSVTFNINTNGPSLEWIGIGFSDHGDFNTSDLCVYRDGHLRDYYISEKFELQLDLGQDCELVAVSKTSFVFRRRFMTCDPKDYAIEPGTTQFIISGGNTFTRNFNSRTVQKTLVYGKLLDQDPEPPQMEKDSYPFQVLAADAHVPSEVTTYWCVVKELPKKVLDQKHHVIQVQAVVQKGNEQLVHHMVVFVCQTDDQTELSSDCNDNRRPKSSHSCSHVIAAWAMGEGPVVYPHEAGLPLGGPNSRRYVMVEMHYNNVEQKSGLRDNSGVELLLTPTLRPNDAAIVELGLIYSDANSIPPGQAAFPISAHCTTDCTSKLPEYGIHVFASQLHAHLTGRKLWTSHYRHGIKIGEINRDDHYSPHWQHLQHVEPHVHVMPGDVLTTTCVYDTRRRGAMTLGGYGIEDEMCVNYLYYYPASELEVCKSAVDNSTLHTYFEKRFNVKKGSISEKYLQIDWNEHAAASLNELYSAAPLNQHCLQSDGDLFPGHPTNWTLVDQPLRMSGPYVKRRDVHECPALNDF